MANLTKQLFQITVVLQIVVEMNASSAVFVMKRTYLAV